MSERKGSGLPLYLPAMLSEPFAYGGCICCSQLWYAQVGYRKPGIIRYPVIRSKIPLFNAWLSNGGINGFPVARAASGDSTLSMASL